MNSISISKDFLSGFHPCEGPAMEDAWSKQEFYIKLPKNSLSFLNLSIYSHFNDLSQIITVNGQKKSLIHGWGLYSFSIKENDIICKLNKLISLDIDKRGLGICINRIFLTNNSPEELVLTKNSLLNTREFIDGKTKLRSFPPSLGIDMEGKCNFKPSCVFCDFENSKIDEGKFTSLPFDVSFLDKLGPFFKYARFLSNCSIGEPFLSKFLPEVLDVFAKKKKFLELTTNGSLLTDKNIDLLLEKKINLYISLDATTAETYARFRPGNFKKIIEGIKKLSQRKNAFPKIFLVFMPMKANLHELEDFFKLCSRLKIDKLIFRPLSDCDRDIQENRGGYNFVYQDEVLSFDKLKEVSGLADKYAKKYDVHLANQLSFGSSVVSKNKKSDRLVSKKRVPICSEPWSKYYVLRGGIKPCCYGHYNIVKMDKFRGFWNGRFMQNLRGSLAKGELSDYCLFSKSCPIVKRHLAHNSNSKISLFRRYYAVLKRKLFWFGELFI